MSKGLESEEDVYSTYQRAYDTSQDVKRRVRFEKELVQDEMFEKAAEAAITRKDEDGQRLLELQKKAAKRKGMENEPSLTKTQRAEREIEAMEKEEAAKVQLKWNSKTTVGNSYFHQQQYATETRIDDASNFILATHLMDYSVKL
jgi:hypothetical protein